MLYKQMMPETNYPNQKELILYKCYGKNTGIQLGFIRKPQSR